MNAFATSVCIGLGMRRIDIRQTLAIVVALSDDEKEMAKLEVESQCPSVSRMSAELDDTSDAFELCIHKPGKGPLFVYVQENNFPVHVSCRVIVGVIKAAEVECGLALPKDCSVHFES